MEGILDISDVKWPDENDQVQKYAADTFGHRQ
jgi:hypothetical protein